jgi:hypothetical protein
MLRRIRDRLTYANVVATIALFIALGGTAWAATALPRNSVGTNQIRNGAIRSADIRDRALQVRDISRRARAALRGARGPAGPPGPAGGAGPGGAAGVAAKLTYKAVPGTVPPGPPPDNSAIREATATCDPGQRATGGGASVENSDLMAVDASYPAPNGSGWTVQISNDPGATRSFTVVAVCVS